MEIVLYVVWLSWFYNQTDLLPFFISAFFIISTYHHTISIITILFQKDFLLSNIDFYFICLPQ